MLLEHGLADEVLLLVYPILSSTGKRFVLNGQIIPSTTVWERIAIALEVPLANLFYDEEGVLLLGNREKPARCILLPEAAARTKKFPEIKIFPTACRIPIWPFVVVVKAGHRTAPEGLLQEKICRNIW